MKKLYVIMMSILLSLSVEANVSSKELGAIDSAFEITKISYLEAVGNFRDSHIYLDGTTKASNIDLINIQLKDVEFELDNILYLDEVDQIDLDRIQHKIELIQKLIEELK